MFSLTFGCQGEIVVINMSMGGISVDKCGIVNGHGMG
jgi:hypothetical protein